MSAAPCLTAHLLNPTRDARITDLLHKATTHDFLAQAGKGVLPAKTLLRWLAQDVLYTRAYVRFLGGMLKQLRLPSSIYLPGSSSQTTLEYRIFDLLVGALTNIQREMRFFEDTCARYGLKLDVNAEAEPVTQSYVDMFEAVPGRGLLYGLVVLWATELCYLRAWRFALSKQEEGDLSGAKDGGTDDEEAQAGRALREQFIPNWTSKEFEDFVIECGNVVDEVAKEERLEGLLAQPGDRQGSKVLKECENVFQRVLWLESGFWPKV